MGKRDVRKKVPVPDRVKLTYHAKLTELLDIAPQLDEDDVEQPRLLSVQPDALELWYDFSQWLEPQMGTGGELERLADWAAKLAGTALKLAAVNHIVENGHLGFSF